MSSQESYFGLGFPNGRNERNGEKSTLSSSAGSTAALNDVDVLMQSYMQQCLSYHEEKQRENQIEGECREQDPPTQAFIPATVTTSSVNLECDTNDDGENSKKVQTDFPRGKDDHEDEIQQKLKNAKMIAQRLASKPLPLQRPTTVPSTIVTSVSSSVQQDDYYPYAQKRDHFLTKVHSNKLHSFLLKNLSYILRKDEEVHSIQLQYLQQQQEISLQQKKRKRQRSNNNNKPTVMGGIGTQERNQYQKSIERNQHSFMPNNGKRRRQKCCALYISGIKQIFNGDVLNRDEDSELVKKQQQMIHELFQSYGSISKVNYYIDKKSGLRKGDAFIMYNWEEVRKQQQQKEEKEEDKKLKNNISLEQGEEDRDNDDDENRKIDSFLKVICAQVREDRDRFFFSFL